MILLLLLLMLLILFLICPSCILGPAVPGSLGSLHMIARALVPLLLLASLARADGPKDNQTENVRPVPPPGITVPPEVRKDLQAGLDALARQIEQLKVELKAKPDLLALLPDVQVYHRAVHEALKYDEFYKANEFDYAKKLLQSGLARARSLREGESPWTHAT